MGEGLVFIKILGYSLKYDQLFIKSDYSLFINVFLYSLKIGLFIIFRPSLFTIHYFLAYYILFIIKRPLFTNYYTPFRPSWDGLSI